MRKTALCFLLIISLWGSGSSQSLQCSLTQGVNSEALKFLAQKQVNIKNSPEKLNTTVCHSEFLNVGTCCDIAGVSKRINETISYMAKKWTSYIEKLGVFKNNVMKGAKKFAPFLSETFLQARVAKLNAVGAASRLMDLIPLIPKDEASAKEMKRWIENFDLELNDYRKQGQKCFDTMKTLRSNIYCAICSADSSKYASPQSQTTFRYKISRDSCAELTSACFVTWRFNFYVTTVTQLVAIIKAKSQGPKAESTFRSDLYLSSDAIDSLRETFNRCQFNEVTKFVTCGNDIELDKYISRLCQLGFIANKNNGYLEGDESVFNELKDDNSEKIVTDEIGQYSRRRLQSTPEPSLSFEMVSIGTVYDNILKNNSELIPGTTVDTTAAAFGSNSHSRILDTLLSSVWAVIIFIGVLIN